MIDINEPIIPYQGIGGIKLYSTIRELKPLLEDRKVKAQILNNLWIRYEIADSLYLFFNLVNGKLFKITTLNGYKGLLWGKIGVGMKAQDFMKIEPSFNYDDFEEVYESSKGVFIETDAVEDTAIWISVYVKEMDEPNFNEGNW
ncbi:hypothetical protein SAMN02745248_01022 [Hathewaya proteolytica DSM 3090]|uniref:Uncharacterized protein n=1 Tax=Hathewaya proteolytica DSM 3090 TaxID=1121331 RepID=A0A1M6MEF1_9CLOT|nr:FAD-binding oxidoreductase [Hathewaya proteolytica]SHJ81824.1 hypothetical protein SAMN02745248_01022 [Hathewaya proteolytica DSM 3090]